MSPELDCDIDAGRDFESASKVFGKLWQVQSSRTGFDAVAILSTFAHTFAEDEI